MKAPSSLGSAPWELWGGFAWPDTSGRSSHGVDLLGSAPREVSREFWGCGEPALPQLCGLGLSSELLRGRALLRGVGWGCAPSP